ncbi:hypothetical protein [Kolteria novifilia]|uniref:hypothetical protein n=1 Tax=Kolteria novifilia TaxID=2527975 RepID=UPI003AF3FFB6
MRTTGVGDYSVYSGMAAPLIEDLSDIADEWSAMERDIEAKQREAELKRWRSK